MRLLRRCPSVLRTNAFVRLDWYTYIINFMVLCVPEERLAPRCSTNVSKMNWKIRCTCRYQRNTVHSGSPDQPKSRNLKVLGSMYVQNRDTGRKVTRILREIPEIEKSQRREKYFSEIYLSIVCLKFRKSVRKTLEKYPRCLSMKTRMCLSQTLLILFSWTWHLLDACVVSLCADAGAETAHFS